MNEQIRKVINEMRAKKELPKTELPKPAPIEEEEDFDEEEEYEEEEVKAPKKVKEVQKETPKEAPKEQIDPKEQILMEIEMLQNNGRYRAELLHQLQEISRALVVIAGVLVDLTGNDQGKK